MTIIAALFLSASLAPEPSENVAVVKRYFEEIWSKGNLASASKIVAPSFQLNSPTMRIVGPTGPDLVAGVVEGRRSSFPDLTVTVEDVVSEGNKVAVRWVAKGTHSGKLGNVEPTGKKISYEGMSIFQVTSGQIYQEWTLDDFRSVLRQLGVDRLEIRR